MKRIQHRRDGFALAVAIGAIVVIGALITGVFFSSTQEFRIGRSTLLQERARTIAENGLYALFDPTQTQMQWNLAWNTAPPGVQDTVVYTSPGAVDTVQLTKLTSTNFLLVSEARVPGANGAEARRRVGMLVALRVPEFNMRGALTVRGGVKVTGSSHITGTDTPIAGWNCPPSDSTVPGIATSDTTQITANGGCDNYACITATPKVVQDTAAGKDSTYFQFGDIGWAELTAMGKIPTGADPAPSLTTDGACDRGDPDNWGDPVRATIPAPCADYYPIIYAPGDLNLQNGNGQGILLVEGDLKVTGNFSFYGPVIVKGSFSTQGTGAHFNGGLMAADSVDLAIDQTQSSVSGNAIVNFSSCALSRAINGASSPMPARIRPWIQLF